MKYWLSFLLTVFIISPLYADEVVNVYTWGGIIPDFVIQQFEKETGIKVNFSTYESNEVMYAKLKAGKNQVYDVIEPSSYYTDRMRRLGMLEQLDKSKLSNLKNIDPNFLQAAYDPGNRFSIPFIWGATGIFINKDDTNTHSIKRWADLWNPQYINQIMLLDDAREVFAMALHVLGYSGNDDNPEHIKEAYLKLKLLQPNIKIFTTAVISILIDEDANLGMVWNGDAYKARKENPQVEFIYPNDGFVIWVDNFAILKEAPHRENAYRFLNFMLRADVAKAMVLDNNFPTANLAAQKLLPAEIKNNPIVYPSRAILSRGEFQMDVGDKALALYEKYWENLKMGG